MSAEEKKSTTEILLGMCVESKEVSKAESDAILAFWRTTAAKSMGDRSKALKEYLAKMFPARADAIWASMTKQQIASMSKNKEAAPPPVQSNPVDELLRAGEGTSHVTHTDADRKIVSQELLNSNTTKQEEETAKSAMYDSLVFTLPAKKGGVVTAPSAVKVTSKQVLQDEISTAATAALAQKNKQPVPTDLNWSQFNLLDKDELKRVVQTINQREGVTTNADTSKMLSMAIQQLTCRVIASGIVKNTWRHSKDSFDEFGRLMGLGEKRGREVYSMAFGPDTFGYISASEATSRQICKTAGQEGVGVIMAEKQNYDKAIVAGAGSKRKLDGEDGPNATPWWIEEARAEERGLSDWVGMAKLNVVDQVVGLGRGGATRRTKVSAPMEIVPSAAASSSSSSSSGAAGAAGGKITLPAQGAGKAGGEDKLKMFNKIKQECPIVIGMSTRDSNVLTKADIAGPITDSVKAIFPSGHGYGVGNLGRGGIRAKLRVPNVNVVNH